MYAVRILEKRQAPHQEMEVDLFLTGVTGFVGRFVLLELLESRPDTKIAVCIRPTKQYSAVERFQREVAGSTLLAPFAKELQQVVVVSAAIEEIERAQLFLKSATHMIHCAANVKHYDPYDVLERDNIHNVQTVLQLAEALHVNSLTLISTCYVHPKEVKRGPIERITAGTPREAFYNDYSYTKWRGEEEVYNARTTIPHIRLMRLSCVGAPARWDLLSHPCAAQAHLGILSFACRGYLHALSVTQNSRISIVPVDIAAKAIVRHTFEETTEALALFQVCPPPSLEAYHFPLSLVFSILQVQFQLPFKGTVQYQSGQAQVPWWYWPLSLVHSKTRKALTLHEKIQEFVYTFTNPDIRFASSLTEEDFPSLRPEEVAYQSCLYAARMSQHVQLEKGVKMPLCDQFWHRMGGKEPVTACYTLRDPISIEEWPTYQTKAWSIFMGYRKCAARLEDGLLTNAPVALEDYFQTLETSMTTPELLIYGTSQSKLKRFWHMTAIEEDGHVKRVMFQFDHGLVDGIGSLAIHKDFKTHLFPEKEEERRMDFTPRKFLPFWMDVWMGLLWLTLVLLMLWDEVPAYDRSTMPTVDVTSIGVQKHDKLTFTGHLLWKLTQGLHRSTKRTSFVFAVPVGFGARRSPVDFLRNDFVSVLLPVSSNMSESEFGFRCSMLRSKTVTFFSWCFQQLLEWFDWEWLRNKALSHVTAVVSSIQAAECPSAFQQVHVVTTTPPPIPFCVMAITSNGTTHYTVRSHDTNVSASRLLSAIQN
jgi:hypothetical protein